ncbi:Ubiquitin carboxyl-terminal hydrolase CYLD [Orchesella cincta]|uniref:Ubiquitin carboxyl-terminal hydrolase CYLD n=1 Tax=Orchesella cincta TaxID=48709 RepID=A0A1D2MLB7_ORCCI|nr:Ubiquitin carboxyl-terminal hydrolase CYLD [Orchesella cincta]
MFPKYFRVSNEEQKVYFLLELAYLYLNSILFSFSLSSMNNLEAYSHLINQEVYYVKNGKGKFGILKSMGFSNNRQNDILAVIDPDTKFWNAAFWTGKLDEVSISQVEIPNRLRQSISKNQRSQSCSSISRLPPIHPEHYGLAYQAQPIPSTSRTITNASSDCIFHGSNTYYRCSVKGLSLDQDVVWLLPDKLQPQSGNPYIGKVKFIGKHMNITGWTTHIAVVHFDQDTTHLSKPISHQFGLFSNVIDVNDLLDLKTWLSSRESITPTCSTSRLEGDNVLSRDSYTQPHSSPNQQEMPSTSVPTECICNCSLNCNNHHTRKDYKNETNTEPDLIELTDTFSMLSISDDAKNRVSNNTDEAWRASIDIDHFKMELIRKDRLFGIQGKDNSCYMDACLFSLFAFNHSLDELLSTRANEVKEMSDSVKKLLKDNVIQPLRRDYFVDFSKTNDLRNILATRINPEFRKSFMDAEDFIMTLLHVLNAPHMFEYDNGAADYVHQIFLPFHSDTSQTLPTMTVQSLILASFKESGLKLRHTPKGLFIVKLPVSNGRLIPCERVLPDLKINLEDISSPNKSAGEQSKASMSLSAIICYRSSHYVAFVRTGKDELSPWIFMDSNPTTGHPNVVLLQYTGRIMADILKGDSSIWGRVPQNEADFAKRLTKDAFMCIYENDSAYTNV